MTIILIFVDAEEDEEDVDSSKDMNALNEPTTKKSKMENT